MLRELSFKLGKLTSGNPLLSIFAGLMILTFCAMGWTNY